MNLFVLSGGPNVPAELRRLAERVIIIHHALEQVLTGLGGYEIGNQSWHLLS